MAADISWWGLDGCCFCLMGSGWPLDGLWIGAGDSRCPQRTQCPLAPRPLCMLPIPSACSPQEPPAARVRCTHFGAWPVLCVEGNVWDEGGLPTASASISPPSRCFLPRDLCHGRRGRGGVGPWGHGEARDALEGGEVPPPPPGRPA